MAASDELLCHAQGKTLVADCGYDSDDFVKKVRRKGMRVAICCNPKRKYRKRRLDRAIYHQRYLVECAFHTLKRFRAVASRYEKTARNFLALVELACAWCWLQ